MGFPMFNGREDESRLSCLLAGKDEEGLMLKMFSLSLRGEAREWCNNISATLKEDWCTLKKIFLDKFSPKESANEFLERLQQLWQGDLSS